MAKQQSDKNCFQSRYGGGWITAAQYITEFLCVVIAKCERQELFDRFWDKPYWNKVFRRQVGEANKLLAEYSVDVILEALRDRRCYRLKSFGAKYLLGPILKEKQEKNRARAAAPTPILPAKSTVVEQPRKPVNTQSKSLFNKLKDLDG
jgi:hypothetical protein